MGGSPAICTFSLELTGPLLLRPPIIVYFLSGPHNSVSRGRLRGLGLFRLKAWAAAEKTNDECDVRRV